MYQVSNNPKNKNNSSVLDVEPNSNSNSKVVLMQHGLMDTSDTFMVLENAHNWTEFFLSQGYTVFLNNSRGNYYSMGNTTLHYTNKNLIERDPLFDQYWDFTFNEMAKYDLPAFIKAVREITFINTKSPNAKLKYIGHSQGTMQMFSALSSDAYVQESISHFVALAPINRLGHQQSKLLGYAATVINPLWKAMSLVEFYRFGVPDQNSVTYYVCKVLPKVCDLMVSWVSDMDPEDTFDTGSYHYFDHFPSYTSSKNMVNFAQMVNSDMSLPEYDYGEQENLQKYNQKTPPTKDLSLIPKNVKILLCAGTQDLLADPTDVDSLEADLKQGGQDYQRKEYNFGHFGFMLDKNLDGIMNDVLQYLESE